MRSNPHYQRPNQLKTSQEQAHNTLKRIFGADKVKDIEEQTELTQIASEETSLLIDSYAQKQLNKADIFEAKAKLEANPEQAEELRQQASNIRDSWQKGSAQRRFVTAIASGVLGGNIHDTLQQAATNTIGAEAAKAIGEAADKGDINRATQLIAHAALGCGLGSTRDGHCSSGAVGAVAGELTAEVVLKTRIEQLLKEVQENHLSEAELYDRLDAIKDEGADLGAFAGALSAYAAGGDAITGGKTGQNAAHNNALCGGVCIAAAAAIITYVTVEGDGNPIEGLEHIGAGEDPLSKALASTTQEAVELSYEHFPEATQATFEVLSMAGDSIDATVTYIDEKTGKTVSGAWNSLDEATQNRIMGGAIVVSVFLPATSVKSIKQIKLADGKIGEVVKGSEGIPVVRVNTQNSATRGTADYDALNNSAPNTRYELDNGSTFRTNSSGRVEEATFTPVDVKVPRDARQTQVGKEGLPDDVGGHIQACSFGGTCDRFNLFPQNKNFNNGEYKKWENEIRNALKQGDDVGPVTIRFERSDPSSARPDSLDIEYSINGKIQTREFRNQPGG